MKNNLLPIIIAMAGILSGCGTDAKRTVVGTPEAEEAAIRMESSKREYETCLKNRAPGRPTCDRLEELYRRDRAAYESSVK